MNFWSHEATFGALVAIGEMAILGGRCETEVCDFDLNLRLILGDQHIFQFQVPMHDIVTMEVADCLTQLCENPAGLAWGRARLLVEVEQTAMARVLDDQNIFAGL